MYLHPNRSVGHLDLWDFGVDMACAPKMAATARLAAKGQRGFRIQSLGFGA